MRILFVLFVLLPIAEIIVLIKVGGAIGSLYTIALILATAFIGAALLRQQGTSTLLRARSKMGQGAMPAQEMVEGIFLAVGGALLLTPGFITDAIGFCCLIPGVRQPLIAWGSKHLAAAKVMSATSMSSTFQQPPNSASQSRKKAKDDGGRVIDGEFDREE